jgi:hypothetical protein
LNFPVFLSLCKTKHQLEGSLMGQFPTIGHQSCTFLLKGLASMCNPELGTDHVSSQRTDQHVQPRIEHRSCFFLKGPTDHAQQTIGHPPIMFLSERTNHDL